MPDSAATWPAAAAARRIGAASFAALAPISRLTVMAHRPRVPTEGVPVPCALFAV
jgi:hypothetical protein